MKQIKLLTLAMVLGCTGAMAQSVVVVMKDGTQQKFGTDYVKEIVFTEESEPVEPESLMLTKTEAYSQGNVVLSFAPATEAYNVVLDMYGTYDAEYLQTGTYTVGTPQTPFSIGNDARYSYIEYVENGKGKVGLESGTAVVSMTEDEYVYTIDMNFTLADGTQFKGKFEGKIPEYSPDTNKGVEIELGEAKYNENPQKPGEFYVKFNDTAWSCDMAIDFMSTPGARVLPAGTYTYSADGGEMTFSSKSYLEIYTPYSNNRFTAGTVTVAENGGSYTISMDLTLEDGRNAKLTYSGAISGTPTFEQDNESLTLNLDDVKVYSNGNVSLVFVSENGDSEVALDVYGPIDAQYLYTGTYNVSAANTPFSIGSDVRYTYVKKDAHSQNTAVTSGTVTVTMTDDYVYTIDMDLTLADGSTFKGSYTGEIPNYNPDNGIEITLGEAKYNENPQKPGEFYVTFNDTAWSCYMAIDFMSTPGATALPAGTYTYSADGGEMTFSSKSYLEIYTPYSNNKFSAGTVTVTENGGSYTIDMDLTLDDGRNAKISYTGAISGTPTFE